MHQPVCDCPDCGGALRRIGEDVSEVLEYVPAALQGRAPCPAEAELRELPAHRASELRPRGRSPAGWPGRGCSRTSWWRSTPIICRCTGRRRSTRARGSSWIARRLPTGSVIAVGCSRRWSRRSAATCVGTQKLHADDTPVPVLDPGRGKTRTGRLWTYVRDDRPAGSTDPPAVLFRYSPDRKGERPQAHLKHFKGHAASRCATPGSTSSTIEAASSRSAAGRMCGASSTTSTSARKSPVAAEALQRIA